MFPSFGQMRKKKFKTGSIDPNLRTDFRSLVCRPLSQRKILASEKNVIARDRYIYYFFNRGALTALSPTTLKAIDRTG